MPRTPPSDESDSGAGGAPEPEDAGANADASSDAAAGEQPGATPPPPAVDPKTAELARERALEPAAIEQAPYGLRFEILEQGPELPWAFVVMNRGTEPVEVSVDPRLLRFELEVPPPPPDPAKKKPAKEPKPSWSSCETPGGIRPAKPDKRLLMELHPDEYVVEVFDPRLYCLPTAGKSALDAGVKVTPRLGWPVKTKPVWRKGKREEVVLPQVAPFVAMPMPKPDVAAAPAPATPAEKSEATDPGVKELVGTPSRSVTITCSGHRLRRPAGRSISCSREARTRPAKRRPRSPCA